MTLLAGVNLVRISFLWGAGLAQYVYRLAASWTAEGIGARVAVGVRFVFSTRRPDRFRGPPSVVPNDYRGLVPWG